MIHVADIATVAARKGHELINSYYNCIIAIPVLESECSSDNAAMGSGVYKYYEKIINKGSIQYTLTLSKMPVISLPSILIKSILLYRALLGYLYQKILMLIETDKKMVK